MANIDKKELKMRELYFDLGRDDYMAMDEYLQSGQAQKDIKAAGYNKGGAVTRKAGRLAKRGYGIARR
jgi:hypothetical protein|tara:strand:- start:303 stop:506 length:204 start_codon:yes stop_codon:yes gene_type:complete